VPPSTCKSLPRACACLPAPVKFDNGYSNAEFDYEWSAAAGRDAALSHPQLSPLNKYLQRTNMWKESLPRE
jgi:hypothetical protein